MSTPDETAVLAAAIDARMNKLLDDLARNPDPRTVELNDLRRMRERYPDVPAGAPTVASPRPIQSTLFGANGNGARQKGGRKMSPERASALAASEALLAGRTTPTPTADIHQHIVGLGIKLKGDAQNNLSALLYRAPRFRSHGRDGWTLESEVRQ